MVFPILRWHSLSNNVNKPAAAVPAQHSNHLSQFSNRPKVSNSPNSDQLIHGLHGAYYSLPQS
jgi:hypothetical protein